MDGVLGGFLGGGLLAGAALLRDEVFERVDDARDDERREGEVFVAIGASSLTPGTRGASSLVGRSLRPP